MIYLATPYTHPKDAQREFNYQRALRITYHYINKGMPIFSPIVHCHCLAEKFDLPKEASFWRFYNQEFIRSAAEIWFCLIPGWRLSEGMQHEYTYGRQLRKPMQEVVVAAIDLDSGSFIRKILTTSPWRRPYAQDARA